MYYCNHCGTLQHNPGMLVLLSFDCPPIELALCPAIFNFTSFHYWVRNIGLEIQQNFYLSEIVGEGSQGALWIPCNDRQKEELRDSRPEITIT